MISVKKVRIYLAVIIVAVIFIFVLTVGKMPSKPEKIQEDYKMTIEDNQVVLYRGDRFITVYSGIVPQNLPTQDRKALKSGIYFESRSEADRAAEDFDG